MSELRMVTFLIEGEPFQKRLGRYDPTYRWICPSRRCGKYADCKSHKAYLDGYRRHIARCPHAVKFRHRAADPPNSPASFYWEELHRARA